MQILLKTHKLTSKSQDAALGRFLWEMSNSHLAINTGTEHKSNVQQNLSITKSQNTFQVELCSGKNESI